MIEFKTVQPEQAILRLEPSIGTNWMVNFSVCRQLPNRGYLNDSLLITASPTPMLSEIDNIPKVGGAELRLKLTAGSVEEASRKLAEITYMVGNPASFDANFFMWYSLIMAGERSGRTGNWHLVAMRIFPEYIDCYYSNDENRYNVVRVELWNQALTVQVVDTDGKARDALEIGYLDQRSYASMGKLRGYEIKRINSLDVPVYWNQLMIARPLVQPDATYLVEEHWTERRFSMDGDNDYIQKNLAGDKNGLVAYGF